MSNKNGADFLNALKKASIDHRKDVNRGKKGKADADYKKAIDKALAVARKNGDFTIYEVD